MNPITDAQRRTAAADAKATVYPVFLETMFHEARIDPDDLFADIADEMMGQFSRQSLVKRMMADRWPVWRTSELLQDVDEQAARRMCLQEVEAVVRSLPEGSPPGEKLKFAFIAWGRRHNLLEIPVFQSLTRTMLKWMEAGVEPAPAMQPPEAAEAGHGAANAPQPARCQTCPELFQPSEKEPEFCPDCHGSARQRDSWRRLFLAWRHLVRRVALDALTANMLATAAGAGHATARKWLAKNRTKLAAAWGADPAEKRLRLALEPGLEEQYPQVMERLAKRAGKG
jgi:hypothetical protein